MRFARTVIAVCCVSTSVASAPVCAATAERPRLLVADLKAEQGINESVVRMLSELLTTELQSTGRWEVVGESDVRAVLNVEARRQVAGCSDLACISEVSGALGAELVLVGSIGTLDALYLVNLKLVNSRKVVVEARWSNTVSGEQSALVAALRSAVADLVRQAGGEQESPAAPTAAAAPATAAPGVPGAAELTAPAPGPLPALAVSGPRPVYRRWWFWTAVGAVVAAGVVATLLLTSGEDERGALGLTVELPAP